MQDFEKLGEFYRVPGPKVGPRIAPRRGCHGVRERTDDWGVALAAKARAVDGSTGGNELTPVLRHRMTERHREQFLSTVRASAREASAKQVQDDAAAQHELEEGSAAVVAALGASLVDGPQGEHPNAGALASAANRNARWTLIRQMAS